MKTMQTIKRTNASDVDFSNLVKLLDADLKIRDGEDHDFYHQFNSTSHIKNCIVAYHEQTPVACGAMKTIDEQTMEIKRMYVMSTHRGKGFAVNVLAELELWAKELGASRCILETGVKQPEAIALYKKSGYSIIPNYGQYEGIENSICFEKSLTR